MKIKKAEFDFIVRNLTEQLVGFLIEDYHLSIDEAFTKVYDTQVYADLSRQSSGLYRYSAAYLYARMNKQQLQ